MKLTPEMIREQRFKAKLSGFDKDEVIHFLMDIADDLEELVEENSLLKSEVASMKDKQKDLEDLFLSAKQFSDEKIRKAEAEARNIVAEADKSSTALEEQARLKIVEAENRGAQILDDAQQRASELLMEARQSKTDLEGELSELRTKRTTLFSELKAILESYQGWIRERGDVDPK
jgi:DivIVA domain-containing protein